MVTKYMHENLKHTVIKHLTRSIHTFRHLLSTIVKTFSDFISNNIDNFQEFIPNDTTHFFWVHIKQYPYFQRVTTKQE